MNSNRWQMKVLRMETREETTSRRKRKMKTLEGSENAEHSLDEREKSSQVDNSGTLKPEEYSPGPDESTLRSTCQHGTE